MKVLSSFLVDVWKNISRTFSFYHFLHRLDIISFMLFTVISIVTFFVLFLYIFIGPNNLTLISKSWWSTFFYLLFLCIFCVSIDNLSIILVFIFIVWGIRSFYYLFIKYSMSFLWRKKQFSLILENYKERSEIVHRIFFHWFFYNFWRNFANKLIFLFVIRSIFNIPETLRNILVFKFIINSIWANHHKIMFLTVYFEVCDLRFCN